MRIFFTFEEKQSKLGVKAQAIIYLNNIDKK
jgi:hypothetical protein